MRAFLDTSVVIALAFREPGYPDKERWLSRNATTRAFSTFGWGEFVDATARKVRRGELRSPVAATIITATADYLAFGDRCETLDADIREATSLIAENALRPLKLADAIHLATARRLGLVLVTSDEQQAAAAADVGMQSHLFTPDWIDR